MGNTKEAVLKITQGLMAGGGSAFQVFSTARDISHTGYLGKFSQLPITRGHRVRRVTRPHN